MRGLFDVIPLALNRPPLMEYHYLDHAATTPMRPGVWAAMEPYASEAFGNASSSHRWGRAARRGLEQSRERVAAILHASPREILFTRGGTEANNLALLGCVRASGRKGAVVTSDIEHPAVRDPALTLERSCVRVPCRPDGGFSMDALGSALEADPAIVSVMWVNNETGDVLPVPAIAEACDDRGVPVHSDAVQAMGKIPVRLDQVQLSMMTLTAHKFGGPKGTGALFIRTGTPLGALYFGGGQERTLRPGTSDVAGAVGLAAALELATANLAERAIFLCGLRDRLEGALRQRFPEGALHHMGGERAPHIVNFGLPNQDRSVLLAALDMAGVGASGGSACASGASGPSPVIAALFGDDHPLTAVRFSLGWTTTEHEVDAAVQALAKIVARGQP